MAQRGKLYRSRNELVDRQKRYTVDEAFEIIKKMAPAKFDESVDMAVRLGVNPRHSDQMVRGAVVLPEGTGKKVRVLVFAKGDKETEAKEAGADYVGLDDLVEKIMGGWFEFDVVLATPDVMKNVAKLGRTLGTKGLMPSPKVGTVTVDVGKAVVETKKGKITYRVDKVGNLHMPIGKHSFTAEALKNNFMAVMESVLKAKPPTAKGQYLKNITVALTMSPGVRVDQQDLLSQLKV